VTASQENPNHSKEWQHRVFLCFAWEHSQTAASCVHPEGPHAITDFLLNLFAFASHTGLSSHPRPLGLVSASQIHICQFPSIKSNFHTPQEEIEHVASSSIRNGRYPSISRLDSQPVELVFTPRFCPDTVMLLEAAVSCVPEAPVFTRSLSQFTSHWKSMSCVHQ
jgi:hypothetical protein